MACMSDFDDEDFTDTDVASKADSVMKVDCNTRKSEKPQSYPNTDMCTHAGEKVIDNHAGDENNPDEDLSCANAPAVHWASGYMDCASYVVPQCLLEWPCRRDRDARVTNNVNDGKLEHSITAAWCVNTEDSSYITVCCDCLWWIDSVRNVTFVFYSWSMLIHTRREGLRDGQKMTRTRTAGGWQYRDVCNIPPGMFSAGEIQWLLIGCCTQVGGSAVRTSHIGSDPTICQAVVAAPVTGSLVSISWLNLRETARNVFSLRSGHMAARIRARELYF